MSIAPKVQPANQLRKTSGRRIPCLIPVCLLALLAASGAVYFRALLWGNNLHTVIAAQVYRSAQPSTEQLDGYITRLGLRTVVSLRGGKEFWPWFVAEKGLCASRGVQLYAVHLEPDRLPGKGELERLIEILDTAPRPMLLHCSRGIDRSGLGSAMALLMAGKDPAQAARQFSLKYGFVAVGHSDLPLVLTEYKGWRERLKRAHSPAAFRQWVHDDYVPYFYRADIRLCPGCAEDTDALTQARAIAPNTWEVASEKPLRLHFQLTNTSPEPWQFRSTKDHGIHLGLIVEHLDAVRAAASERREIRTGYKDVQVAAGQTLGMHAELPPFPTPGRYRVTVDLVDESVTWFHDMGSPTLRFEFQVRDASVVGL
jgi:protein tyrosine phosphatase (PTP) superfamily phosphohydrolase (DUF442 family)